jgi:malonate transporter
VLSILLVTFPFFALVLAGYIAARRRMLPLEAIAGLNGFVLFFALPRLRRLPSCSTPACFSSGCSVRWSSWALPWRRA